MTFIQVGVHALFSLMIEVITCCSIIMTMTVSYLNQTLTINLGIQHKYICMNEQQSSTRFSIVIIINNSHWVIGSQCYNSKITDKTVFCFQKISSLFSKQFSVFKTVLSGCQGVSCPVKTVLCFQDWKHFTVFTTTWKQFSVFKLSEIPHQAVREL